MFDQSATKEDVDLNFEEPPEKIEMGAEYLGAILSSKQANNTWEVWVKFVADEPSYVTEGRKRANEKKSG